MPVKTPNGKKASSPSNLIQQGINKSWGGQEGYKTPQAALADKFNKQPVKVGGSK